MIQSNSSAGRRRVLAGLAAFIASPGLAWAQAFPSRPVKLMVGFAAGGATDLTLRAIAEQAGRHLGQPVVVETRTGAGGTLPAQLLQTAQPDGYTIAHIGAAVYRLPYTTKLAWDPYKDVAHVIRLAGYALGVAVAASGGASDWRSLADSAKRAPDTVTYGTVGVLSGSHVAMELLCEKAGLRMNHIPYRSGVEVRHALLGGHIAAGVDGIGQAYVPSGPFRVLCLWTDRRIALLPDTPTLVELGMSMVETASFGIGAPRGTPTAVMARLHDAFKYSLDQPSVRELFERENMLAQYLDGPAYLETVQAQFANERKTLQRLGLIPG